MCLKKETNALGKGNRGLKEKELTFTFFQRRVLTNTKRAPNRRSKIERLFTLFLDLTSLEDFTDQSTSKFSSDAFSDVTSVLSRLVTLPLAERLEPALWLPSQRPMRALFPRLARSGSHTGVLACTEKTLRQRKKTDRAAGFGQQSKWLTLGTLQATTYMLHASFIMRIMQFQLYTVHASAF